MQGLESRLPVLVAALSGLHSATMMTIPTQYMPYFLIALIVIMLAETLRAYRRYKAQMPEPPADSDNRERITDISDVIGRLLFLAIFIAIFIYSIL